MQPLPRWIGFLGGLVAVAPTLWTAYHTSGWSGLLMAIAALVGGGAAVTAHSLVGTGGKTA